MPLSLSGFSGMIDFAFGLDAPSPLLLSLPSINVSPPPADRNDLRDRNRNRSATWNLKEIAFPSLESDLIWFESARVSLTAHCSAPSLNDIPSLPTQYAPLQIYPLCSFSPSLRLNEGRHSHQSGLGSSLGVWCGRVASPADLVPVSPG